MTYTTDGRGSKDNARESFFLFETISSGGTPKPRLGFETVSKWDPEAIRDIFFLAPLSSIRYIPGHREVSYAPESLHPPYCNPLKQRRWRFRFLNQL